MSTAKTDNPAKSAGSRRPKSAQPATPAKAIATESSVAATKSESAATPTRASAAASAKAGSARLKPSKAIESRSKQARKASVMLKFVSDPTRLQVILFLAEDEQHVGALCDQLGQSQPAVSHHLALLRHGGIIIPRRQGKNNYYSLSPTGAELAKILKILIVSAS